MTAQQNRRPLGRTQGGSIPAERVIPWARVSLEGFVIVVSILLAFAIDAAWDQHVERREEAEILADLRAEVGLNLQGLDRIIAQHQRVLESAGRLVTMTGSQLRPLSAEEIRPFFSVLFSRVSFTPVNGTLAGALSSGKLQYIQNDSIRNGLVAWHSLTQDAEEEAVWLHEATVQIVEYARGSGLLSAGAKMSGRGLSDAFLADLRTPGEILAGLAGHQAFNDLLAWKADLHWEYIRELVVLRDMLGGIAEELAADSD